MAVFTKKLKIQKTGASAVNCNIYSTTTEAGSTYMYATVDGTQGYIALGTTSDANATVGRVTKGGTTYAIKSQSKPPYTEKSYTTAGTYTFTVPGGVTRMRVAVCGGGGGGCGTSGDTYQYVYAGDGGTSSFGSLIQATGGKGGYTYEGFESWDDGAYTYINCYPGEGGSPNGNSPSGSNKTGGAGFALSFTKTSGTYGKGGDTAYKYNGNNNKYPPGGSGGYDSNYITVTSGTTYTITVGAAGAGKSGHYTGYAGNAGFVLIAYGGDI